MYGKSLALVLFYAIVGGVVLVFLLAFIVGFIRETIDDLKDRWGKR